MQATRRDWQQGASLRVRTLAALLACALGLTVVAVTGSVPRREHGHHQTSVVAKTADVTQVAPRNPDLYGVVTAATITDPTGPLVGSCDLTPTANSHTAVTCSARGPPAEAAA
jgi:multidrug resistance efflux pump